MESPAARTESDESTLSLAKILTGVTLFRESAPAGLICFQLRLIIVRARPYTITVGGIEMCRA